MDQGHDQSQPPPPPPPHEQRPPYTTAPWTHLHHQQFAPSPHLSPAHEYGGFNFMHSIHPAHGLTTEATGMTHGPLPLQPMQSLRPLVMPPWPSTLTAPSSYMSPALPLPPLPPPPVPSMPSATATAATITTPISAASSRSTHSGHSTSSPRRTLTDTDRRKMCQYHEDNPTVKQTEIGALFGVERSTVSKVLRHKEKYLFPDDGRRSPVSRSKGRFPDIERAVSNWARNLQRTGTPVSDNMIREKAKFFANTVGNSDSHAKINSRSWLEKFKQRNHLVGPKAGKMEGDDASDAEARRESNNSPSGQGSNGISPVSPKGGPLPSPLTTARSHESLKTESPDSYVEFAGGYRLCNSHSATSLSSVFTDTAPSSFSAGPTSPTSPYYSPPDGTGHFFPTPSSRLPPMSHPDWNHSRPRSQTFPTLAMDPTLAGAGPSADDLTPRYHGHPPRPGSPPNDSPSSDMGPPPLPPPARDHLLGQSHQGHTGSNSPSSMPPPQPSGSGWSGFGQVRGSPTPEDARRALEVVMAFFQHQPSGMVDPQEFMTMGKLMEKLRLQGTSHGPSLPGGLHQIPEQEELGSMSSRLESTAAGL
ncbi:MAG: hypothetical protein M1823_003595 [Watsoniomyces obsoletus]|nr:MAG: hypothetical protein M1823_003595 [Watsoniomyces obsoletus]